MRVVVSETEGEIQGYACMGRGEDLTETVHEWGGDVAAVLSCISKIWADAQTDRLFVMLGETDIDLAAYFSFVKASGTTGVLSMARIANIDALAEVFDAATPEEVSVSVVPDTEEPTLDLRSSTGDVRLTGHELLLALCPPKGDRRVTDATESELRTALPGLPLKPFVRGLDGI